MRSKVVRLTAASRHHMQIVCISMTPPAARDNGNERCFRYIHVHSGVVLWEAVKRLTSAQPPEVEATPWAFAVIALSIAVDFFRARVLYRTAEKTSSHALAADALHFASDMWSSLAVLVGLFGIALGYTWADSVAAIALSVVVCLPGWRPNPRPIDTPTRNPPPGAAP